MQIQPTRKGVLAAVLVGLTAALVVLGGATGPVAAVPFSAGASAVGPGTQLVTAGRTCTASFVFRDSGNRTYLGYAASCATRTAATGNPCAARPLPLGTRVRLADRGRTLGYGELRYSSLRALRRAGVVDAATCAANDFALVQIRGTLRRQADATMPYWGGPSGLGELPAAGTTVFGLTRPSPGARTLPRAGQVSAGGGGTATVTTPLASGRAARGSGFLDSAGQAVGILTTSTATGENTVVSLADAVAFASQHGVPGLRIVHGHATFTGSAIL
ncbi:hypothetical protein ACVW00_003110 [Marmoricola sp. URHA0025 HA25]